MKKKCVVVIPVYLSDLSGICLASFRQALNVLKKYDITLVTYEELDISKYKEVACCCGKTIQAEYFDKDFFSSVAGYNRLCLSTQFYERFTDYSYMLIYQLDAWVFYDNLEVWCDKGYDYIGPPLFHILNITPPIHTYRCEGVGNGGLSLRKVSHCLRVLNSNRKLPYLKLGYMARVYYDEERDRKRSLILALFISFGKALVRSLGYRNTLHAFLNDNIFNEDAIFSVWAQHSNVVHGVRLPEPIEAAKFAFEVHPEYLYRITGQMPFGCHAFQKWEYESFWKKHIKI